MFQRIFQFQIHRKIENNLKNLSSFTQKYLEAFCEDFETMITPQKEEEWNKEIGACREEIAINLHKSRINTSLKVEKYKLFLRINYLLKRIQYFHHDLVEFKEELTDKEIQTLKKLLKDVLKLTNNLQESIECLYSDFIAAQQKLQLIEENSQEILKQISAFKYPSPDKKMIWDPHKPAEIIGTTLREIIQAIFLVKDKNAEIIEEFRQDTN
ncbi:MAG: hypothetical protein U9O98_02045 [Asgard group archaeon]|nr:hypothetical protein [Asgard group archaeon]